MKPNLAQKLILAVGVLLCLVFVLIQALPRLGGQATADGPILSYDARRQQTGEVAHPGRRLLHDAIRFHGETPRIYRRADRYPMRSRPGPAGHFENFAANLALFRLINSHRHPWLDGLAIIMLYLGSGWFLLPIFMGVAWFRWSRLPVLLGALALETIIVVVLKDLLKQPRPVSLLDNVYLTEVIRFDSFPSGDVAMAMVLAWVIKRRERWWVQAIALAYAVLIAWERIYLGAHFPLDVLAGALLGILAAEAVERLAARRHTAPVPPTATAPRPASAPAGRSGG